MGLVSLAFGGQPILIPIYAVSFASLRWFLWQDGSVLRRQYDTRSARWAEKQAARRRNR